MSDEAPAPELTAEQLDDLLDDQADAAEDFLNGLLDVLDLDGEAEADIEDDMILVDVSGPDMGLLIGRHGSTLEALQELTRAAVQHASATRVKLALDIEGYRERQREILGRRARSVAAKVLEERTAVEFEPMTAFERKVIHSVLAEMDGVITASEGEEPERYIVVKPA
ncbi:MAG: protein jag [Actinomycetota bacterium]